MLAIGMLATVISVGGMQPTEAAWTNAEHARTTVTAATLTSPTIVSCQYTATLTSFTATYTLSNLPPPGTVVAQLQQLPLLGSWTNVGPTRVVSPTTGQVAMQHGALLGTFRTVFTVTVGTWTISSTSSEFGVLANAVGSC